MIIKKRSIYGTQNLKLIFKSFMHKNPYNFLSRSTASLFLSLIFSVLCLKYKFESLKNF